MWSAISSRIINLVRGKRQRQSTIIKNDVISTGTNTVTAFDLPVNQVYDYLRLHPDFIENYIMEEVELEQLERWIIRKSQRSKKKVESSSVKSNRKTSLSRWKFCVHADKRRMLQDLTQSLQSKPTKNQVVWELASCICSAVNADSFRLYLPERGDGDLQLLESTDHVCQNGDTYDKGRTDVALYVAQTRVSVRIASGVYDSRFHQHKGELDNADHLLCQAITYPDGNLAAILQLWRSKSETPFHEEDEEIVCSYLVWGGIALHYAHLYLDMNQQRKLNDFLLAVVKSIFQDMVSMDILVIKIMNFAQRLVDADRASLFLIDSKNKELYATIFDVRLENTDNTDLFEDEEFVKVHNTKEIRFSLGTGIAGQVAMTGDILNIPDAYADSRFNRTIDQLTGYKTNTILCMPIFIRGSVIGVVQMVNKQIGCFTKEDEEAFKMFGVYCGLALHHAKLYDKIRRSEQKYRVALEVLSYHNSCTEEELEMVIGDPPAPLDIDNFYFNPFDCQDYEKAKFAIYMFTDLFGLARFDEQSLLRFVLTVRKNYRRVPYHNWSHGFSVAHCMYCIIKHSKNVFQSNECLALFIGALCHDLDHRGKNNKFMLDTESPLAAIYSTSTMEHHHFNQTVTILQQEGHNIFSKLSSSEYKQVLSLIKHCILATDLALFFPNKTKLFKIMEENSFSWSNQDHRLLIQAISMTASDLCASAKPWDVQVETVKVIFEEFYQQGDEERAAGRTPIPMMDRNETDQQASSQVGFLTGICEPCYTLLQNLIPETKPLLNMCQKNLNRWKNLDVNIQKAKKL